MTGFEFVVSEGRAERVTAALRSHAVRSGLQRRGANQPAPGSQHSQETISQKSQLKGRFRIQDTPGGPASRSKRGDAPKVASSKAVSPEAIEASRSSEFAVRTREVVASPRSAFPIPGLFPDNRLLRAPSAIGCGPFEALPIFNGAAVPQGEGVDELMRHFLSQYAFNLSAEELRKYWWGFTLCEPIVLHTAFGVAASIWANGTPHPRLIEYEGSKQKAFAIRGIREKLARNERNNALIGAIANLASMESILGNFDIALVHMRGLQKLLEHRGGLALLKEDMDIARAVTWADLLTATGLGIRPMMPLTRSIQSVRIPIHVMRFAELPSISHLETFERSPTDWSLRSIFQTIRQAQHALKLQAMPVEELRHLINALEHNLLNVSVEEDLPQPMRVLLHAACLFSQMCLREFVPECQLPKAVLARVAEAMATPVNFYEAVSVYSDSCRYGMSAILWAMVVTAIASPRRSAALKQAIEHIRRAAAWLRLRHIDEIKSICQTFLWDEEIMGSVLTTYEALILPANPAAAHGWTRGMAPVEEIATTCRG